MLRQAGKRLFRRERERRERPHDIHARAGIGDDRVLCPIEDLDRHDADNALQIIFQKIRFAQRHTAKREMHAHAPGRLMQNVTLHMLICTSEKQKSRKNGSSFACLRVYSASEAVSSITSGSASAARRSLMAFASA